jgi:hypothetical protein
MSARKAIGLTSSKAAKTICTKWQLAGVHSDAGVLAITLNELLRTDFPNNAVVNIGKPVIEGIVEGDVASWNYSVDRVIPIEFAIEEKA